jgi:hypothetical protein
MKRTTFASVFACVAFIGASSLNAATVSLTGHDVPLPIEGSSHVPMLRDVPLPIEGSSHVPMLRDVPLPIEGSSHVPMLRNVSHFAFTR